MQGKQEAALSQFSLFPDERCRNVQPVAQVFVFIIRKRKGVSVALTRIMSIYYTEQDLVSKLFDNNIPTHARAEVWIGLN